MVVNIHSGTAEYWDSDMLRSLNNSITSIAVPVFFVLSSYFVFRKMRLSYSYKPIVQFELRINRLYFSWIVLLSPIILMMWHKEYLDNNILVSVGLFVKNYFLAYQFGASWFLGALVVGVPVIVILTKIFQEEFVGILPLIVYLYLYIVDESHFFYSWYIHTIRTPLLSFPNGLLWLCIGYYMTNEYIMLRLLKIPNYLYAIIITFYLLSSLFLESYLFIIKIPTVVSVIMLLYKMKFRIGLEKCKFLRNSSIVIFCMHFNIICILNRFPIFNCKPLLFLVAFTVSFIGSIILLRMSRMKGFGLLKNLY